MTTYEHVVEMAHFSREIEGRLLGHHSRKQGLYSNINEWKTAEDASSSSGIEVSPKSFGVVNLLNMIVLRYMMLVELTSKKLDLRSIYLVARQDPLASLLQALESFGVLTEKDLCSLMDDNITKDDPTLVDDIERAFNNLSSILHKLTGIIKVPDHLIDSSGDLFRLAQMAGGRFGPGITDDQRVACMNKMHRIFEDPEAKMVAAQVRQAMGHCEIAKHRLAIAQIKVSLAADKEAEQAAQQEILERRSQGQADFHRRMAAWEAGLRRAA